MQSYSAKVSFKETKRSIFLQYTQTPNTNHIGDHYDAIADIEIPTMQVHTATKPQEPIIIDDEVITPLQHLNNLESELNLEQIPPSAEEDGLFEIQQHPKKSKAKGQKSYLNMGLFIGLEHEVID